jgi:CheY-like chemotaxis protein
MLRRLIGEDIELDIRLDPDLGRVKADPGQLEQVILNLAVNARDAMPMGGRVTIATGTIDLDETEARALAAPGPGRFGVLSVADTGIGMDERTKQRLFEPFFTTKDPGKGTGLGLATVYGIVEQSGGFIAVQSAAGNGSTFTIHIPLAEGHAEAQRAAATGRVPHGSETVLVAEDDAAVRTATCQILRRYGYTVLEAPVGDVALGLAAKGRQPIHLLLTDVVMPGMGGRELAERVAAHRPGISILYMSGYADDAKLRPGVLDPGIPYLQKPFSPEALARKVREVLDAGSTA